MLLQDDTVASDASLGDILVVRDRKGRERILKTVGDAADFLDKEVPPDPRAPHEWVAAVEGLDAAAERNDAASCRHARDCLVVLLSAERLLLAA